MGCLCFISNLILTFTFALQFSAITTSLLSLCGVLGYMVPGVVLVYVLLMVVMTGPGVLLHLLPDSFYERLSRMRAALRGDTAGMG